MDIDEWSQDSQAFKTITSQQQTRNQTTNKKQYSKPKSGTNKSMRSSGLRSNNKAKTKTKTKANTNTNTNTNRKNKYKNWGLEDLQILIGELFASKQKLIKTGRYNQIVQITNQIRQIQQQINAREREILSASRQKEQLEIYQHHENQMAKFREIWDQIFQKLNRKQQILKVRLQAEEERDARIIAKMLCQKQQQIEKKYAKNRQLIEIQKIEAQLVRQGKFEQLVKMNIQSKKKQIKSRLKHQRNEIINKMYQMQSLKLKQRYKKRHNSHKMKMAQCRDYEHMVYKKNEEVLKKKFLNAVTRNDQGKMQKNRPQSAHK